MEKIEELKLLTEELKRAQKAYETEDREIMSNLEYDRKYDRLLELEKETNTVLAGSPSQKIGYVVSSLLPKEKHDSKMLSLDKTKDVSALVEFLNNKVGVLSWKLDGLTVVLTYENGELTKAVTRGNGEIGEVITENAKQFKNIPLKISFSGKLVIRGEAIIRYSTFNRINEKLEASGNELYKNPRNLCSGSVRQLDTKVTKTRNVEFYAFKLVNYKEYNMTSVSGTLGFLEVLGFDTVDSYLIENGNSYEVKEAVKYFSDLIKNYDIPSDGLVLTYEDIEYGVSLGSTAKFPKHSIAFKWKDETQETELLEIEWSVGRTGVITPVAIFTPVELEGSTVSRASIHNITIVEELKLGLGDKIEVYKANMIIPQILKNLTQSNTVEIPYYCPVCGEETTIRKIDDSEILLCENDYCSAKDLRKYAHFVSRDALNIKGISTSTLEKLLSIGAVEEFADLFKLENYELEIINTEGLGEISYQNMIHEANIARKTTLARMIYGLGIPNIGLGNAKMLCRAYNNDLIELVNAKVDKLIDIQGVGYEIASSFYNYFRSGNHEEEVENLLEELILEEEYSVTENELIFNEMTFVCTGAVNVFKNRDEMKNLIEMLGGKLAGSVSGSTEALITNTPNSGTTKNREAQKLGVTIITEQQFIDNYDLGKYIS